MAIKLSHRWLCSLWPKRRLQRWKMLIILLWSLIFYFLLFPPRARKIFKVSEFPWLESNAFIYIDKGTQGTIGTAKFLMVLPYSSHNEMNEFSAEDQRALAILEKFLTSMKDFQGASCLQQTPPYDREGSDAVSNIAKNLSFQSSWCSFMQREWSVNIRNTGPLRKVHMSTVKFANFSGEKLLEFQTCNIVQGPFVIRKDVFDKIGGLDDGLGKVTLLDFFLRSKGELKIAKLANCAWSPEVSRRDRGTLEGSKFFPDYATLGNNHGVLRIVMPSRIEWTACLANGKYCHEKPYVKPQDLPNIALPICCHVVLNEMLMDFAWAFEKLDIDYRVVYGTLLGAVRSQSVIPWTYDVDLAIPYFAFHMQSTYTAVQKVLGNKYYVGSSVDIPRAHMHVPAHINVDTARFFDGPNDVKGNALFGPEFDEAVRGMLPISTHWSAAGYVDFYEPRWGWMWSNSTVTINGRKYYTVKNVRQVLKSWYGENYLRPRHVGEWYGFS